MHLCATLSIDKSKMGATCVRIVTRLTEWMGKNKMQKKHRATTRARRHDDLTNANPDATACWVLHRHHTKHQMRTLMVPAVEICMSM